jgi:hypothetical protein
MPEANSNAIGSGMSLGACAAGLRDGDVAGWIDRVRSAEELGYGVLGMSDSFVSLATAAGQTSRTRLATMCTNPATRHPSVVASDISVINAISGGRAVLVIGRGLSQVISLGLRPATTKLLGDYVKTLIHCRLRSDNPEACRGSRRRSSRPLPRNQCEERPLSFNRDLAGASRRSIVAADIDISSAAVSSSMASSPNRRSTGTSSSSIGASRLPAGAFSTAQHFSSAPTTVAPYLGSRSARVTTIPGRGALRNARRA